MDVEKLRKMNELTVELKKHHIVGDMNEAAKLAEELYDRKGEMKPILNEGKEKEGGNIYTNDEISELRSQVRSLVSQNKSSSEQIASLISKMNEMIGEINKLDSRIKDLHSSVGSSSQRSQPQQEQRKESSQRVQDSDDKPISKKMAENGSLKPGDIQIEKYFYFGNK